MRLSNQSIALAHRGVDLKVEMFLKEYPKYWDKMVRVVTNRELFLRTISISSLPPAQAVNEGSGVVYADISVPWSYDFYHVKRGIGFALSTETIQRDELSVFRDRDRMIGASIEQARELSMASFMNLATQGGTNFVCPDGLSWANTGHLLASGTFSNILSTSGALGPGSLAQAKAELFTQPDHNGIPIGYGGAISLWVHPNNLDEAKRLVHATSYPNTGNLGDPNTVGEQVTRIVSNPFFTNPGAWAIVIDGDRNPFAYIDERPTRFETQYEVSRDVLQCVNYSTWGQAMFDARGWVYSPGI